MLFGQYFHLLITQERASRKLAVSIIRTRSTDGAHLPSRISCKHQDNAAAYQTSGDSEVEESAVITVG